MLENKYEDKQHIKTTLENGAFVKCDSIHSALVEHGYVYPHINSVATLDSVKADNFQDLKKTLTQLHKKLKSKLPKGMKPEIKFLQHLGFKHLVKGSSVRYIPMSMELEDGQMLIGLARQTSAKRADVVDKSEAFEIPKWFLNEQDITKTMFLKGKPKDISELATRLVNHVEATHMKFSKANPEIAEENKAVVAQIEALKNEIVDIKIDAEPEGETYEEEVKRKQDEITRLSELAKAKGLNVHPLPSFSVDITTGLPNQTMLKENASIFKGAGVPSEAEEFINAYEPKTTPKYKGEVSPENQAEVNELLSNYDFTTFAIEDGKQRKTAEANNELRKEALSLLGVEEFYGKGFEGADVTIKLEKAEVKKELVVFNKIKLLKLIWSEASDKENIEFKSFDGLQKFIMAEYINSKDIPTEGYDKHKVELTMETEDGTDEIGLAVGGGMGRIDVGQSVGDFNPYTQHIRDYIAQDYKEVKHSKEGEAYKVELPLVDAKADVSATDGKPDIHTNIIVLVLLKNEIDFVSEEEGIYKYAKGSLQVEVNVPIETIRVGKNGDFVSADFDGLTKEMLESMIKNTQGEDVDELTKQHLEELKDEYVTAIKEEGEDEKGVISDIINAPSLRDIFLDRFKDSSYVVEIAEELTDGLALWIEQDEKAIEDATDDEKYEFFMQGLRKYAVKRYDEIVGFIKPQITAENIAEFYPTMSEADKKQYGFTLNTIFNERYYKVFDAVITLDTEPEDSNKYIEYKMNGDLVKGQSFFGVKDNLEPIDEYIAKIKASPEYLAYVASKEPKEDDSEKIADDIDKLHNIINSAELEKSLDDLVGRMTETEIEMFEEQLGQVADRITELMKKEQI